MKYFAKVNCLHTSNPGKWLMHVVQLIMFAFLYGMVRRYARPYEWEEYPVAAAVYLVIGLLTIPAFSCMLGIFIPYVSLAISRGDFILQDKHMLWMAAMAE